MIDEKLQELFAERWAEVALLFNHPQVPQPRLLPHTEGSQDTALFKFETKETQVSEPYLRRLEAAGLPLADAMDGSLQHEMGHYMYFPRDLANALALSAIAESAFGRKGGPIYALFGEFVDEINAIRAGQGPRIPAMRHAMSRSLRTEGSESADLWTMALAVYDIVIDKLGALPERELATVPPTLKRLQEVLGADPLPGVTGRYRAIADALIKIDYYDDSPEGRRIALIQFGKAIKDHIHEVPGFYGVVDPDGLDPATAGPGDIANAIPVIIQRYGKDGYRKIKDWIARHRPEWKDPLEVPGEPKPPLAGTEGAELEFNDEQIPFYRHWAAGYPLYIVKRPRKVEEADEHPAGLRDFEPSDPVARIDPHGSRGVIGVPGISKIRTREPGFLPVTRKCTPDLLCVLDSSGSMPHPGHKSFAVAAAYILGNNYHANGVLIGGANFSSDLAYLSPSRDLQLYRSLMTAYWGGGTVLNTAKLDGWIRANDPERRIRVSTQQDYEDLLHRLPPEQRREFLEKRVNVAVSRIDRERLERLDCVIITDGGICNIEETIGYLQGLSSATRVYAFLVDAGGYKEWAKFHDPAKNIHVYHAERPKDLLNLSLGVASALPATALEIGG